MFILDNCMSIDNYINYFTVIEILFKNKLNPTVLFIYVFD